MEQVSSGQVAESEVLVQLVGSLPEVALVVQVDEPVWAVWKIKKKISQLIVPLIFRPTTFKRPKKVLRLVYL